MASPIPMEMVFIRHGQSEANIMQRDEKNGVDIDPVMLEEVYARADFEQKLSDKGVEEAQIAGEWMRTNGLDPMGFDERFVSPFYRTLETAALLGGVACAWLPDYRLTERDWGEYGSTPLVERRERFPETEKRKAASAFFTRYDGGENIPDVAGRLRDFINSQSREMADKRVLMVAHGELMWTARFVLERMLPQDWQKLDEDKSLQIRNCNILQYSRTNPENPADISSSLSGGWRRIIDPIDESRSPYGGEWQKLPGKRRYSGEELLEIVSARPRLLSPREIQAAKQELVTESQL